MKKYLLLIFLTLLLIPGFTTAEPEKTIEIQGVIGDYAQEDRIFEVDGKIYKFDEDIMIQAPDETVLTFAALKGGVEIKIIGEKTFDPKNKTKEKIKFTKIIVLQKQQIGQ